MLGDDTQNSLELAVQSATMTRDGQGYDVVTLPARQFFILVGMAAHLVSLLQETKEGGLIDSLLGDEP